MNVSSRPTFTFRLTRDCVVDIQLSGEVTQEGVDLLIDVLQLVKKAYPTQIEVEAVDNTSGAAVSSD